MRILIVDDSEDIKMFLESFLHSKGYTDIMTASSSSEAFQLLNSRTSIDLILMDIMMPEIDGIEACKTIKSNPASRDISIIMVTAKEEPEYLERALNAGAMDYIKKPINKAEFIARVRSALRLKAEIDIRKAHEQELAKRNKELEQALSEINTLRELIPICSYCKKVRDDKGYWERMEVHVSRHSNVNFSHGICEECLKEHHHEYSEGD